MRGGRPQWLLVAQRERWLQTPTQLLLVVHAATAGFGRSAWFTLIFGERLRTRRPDDLSAGGAAAVPQKEPQLVADM
jgi:hypothetical protein